MTPRLAAGALVVLALVTSGFLLERGGSVEPCGAGFKRSGARCCPGVGHVDEAGACTPTPPPCPAPLALAPGQGCLAPDVRLAIPAVTLALGSADWEADGAFPARTVHAEPFAIDAFELTVAQYTQIEDARAVAAGLVAADPARAASGLTFAEATRACQARGGRVPTEDEWIAAALFDPAKHAAVMRRYPWGDTGAVCRRAAWALSGMGAREEGACGRDARGPDTVGAHPDGRSAAGLYDVAGNVAEWVRGDGGATYVKGGGWNATLATELRVWARHPLAPEAREPWVGVRCAYDAP